MWFGVWPAHAQRHIHTSYTKSDGLPSDYVFHITQAPTGEMWFGTERGAALYDGTQFQTFTTEEGLPHNFVYAIHEDSKGRTWFGTASDTPAYLSFGRIRSLAVSGGGAGGIYDITETRTGVVVFRHYNGLGLWVEDAYRFHALPLNTTKESRFQTASDGSILLNDGLHVLRIRPDRNLELHMDTLLTHYRRSNFMSIALTPDGSLFTHILNEVVHHRIQGDRIEWVGRYPIPLAGWMTVRTAGGRHTLIAGTRQAGLQILDKGGFIPLRTSQSKDRSHVSAMHMDYEGNLWVAFFGEGIEKISNWNTLRFNRQSGLHEDNIWRMNLHGDRLYLMSKAGLETLDATTYGDVRNMPIRMSVRGIAIRDELTYIATMYDLRAYRTRGMGSSNPGPILFSSDFSEGINDVLSHPDGSLWIATAGNRIYRRRLDGGYDWFTVKNGVEKLVLAGKDVWWLTSDDGAFRYRNGVITAFRHQSGRLPSNTVQAVSSVNGTVLIGTRLGLVRVDGSDQTTWITPSEGLTGVSVEAIFQRDSSSAWVATREHLHIWDASGIRPVSSLATLRSELASAHWHTYSADLGIWYMATPNGVVMVDLNKPARPIPAPKVAISGFRLNDISYRPWQVDSLRHIATNTSLEILFRGLTFVEESATRYIVKLDGVDETWSPAQRANSIRYANLAPGTYVFRVKAVNMDGLASTAEATLRITLLPPLWMHPVTRIVAGLVLLLIVAVAIRMRIAAFKRDVIRRNEQRQFEAIQRISASISHDIRNTVFSLNLLAQNLEKRFDNPEFRKDAIETIESSLQYLTKLVDQLQQRSPGHTVTTSEIGLARLVNQVLKRQPRSHTEIRYTNEIPEDIRLNTDPDLLTRILDNLIRNAAEAITSQGTVRVHVHSEGPEIRICVTDDGPGMDADFVQNRLFRPFQSTKTKGLGIGLYTCREMARSMDGRLDVDSKPGLGTTICLVLPNS